MTDVLSTAEADHITRLFARRPRPAPPKPKPAHRLPIDHLDVDSELIAQTFEISVRTAQRWIQEGVPLAESDQFAIRIIGDVPVNVWPHDWENAPWPDIDLDLDHLGR